MQDLQVIETAKTYKFYQWFGMADGTLVGTISLNGTPMHELRGESAQIATSEAQTALQQGENRIRVEFSEGAGTLEYTILAVGEGDDGSPSSSDHVVELNDEIPADGPHPWIKEYRFLLEGPAFSGLKQ